MNLEKAIEYIKGETPDLSPALLQRDVTSFVIDSREVKAGDVFFALSQPEYLQNGFNGEFADSTAFTAEALDRGAIAAVIRRDRFEEHFEQLESRRDRLIFVEDVIAGFQRLAHGVCQEWDKPIVAITGSAGKTTAKELTAHVLEASGRKVLRNIKNYNNGLGHPLTVLRLAADATYDIAVLEMGMSTPLNEIARLCRITPPDVAVELNVLPVHIEHLGTIENIAKAKAELVEGMKAGGTAILNADDQRVAAMAPLSKGSVVTYGIREKADISATDVVFEGFGKTRFRLNTPTGSAEVVFPLNGTHSVMNALAAAAAGHVFGMEAGDIAAALSSVSAPPQRGEILQFAGGFTLINDSYNSNPDALLSMVDTLVDGSPSGSRTIVVAGEMLELGDNGSEIHRETGVAIASRRIDVLIGVRGLAADLVNGARSAGLAEVKFADNSDAAGEMLLSIVRAGDVVLVKGSRGVRTEKVIEKLTEKFELEDARPATR